MIEKKKEEIIRLKLDAMFKYVSADTTSRQFKKNLEEYNEESILHKKTLEQYDGLYDNVERLRTGAPLPCALFTTTNVQRASSALSPNGCR